MIRRAKHQDINALQHLLSQVLELHADLRPDIFISGTTKYTHDQLEVMLNDEDRPIFVACDDTDQVVGYAFCALTRQPFTTTMKDFTTLYIDDLCVDEKARGQHIGKALFDYVVAYAKTLGCYDVTLNVWQGNDAARSFYDAMGMQVKETMLEYIIK